MGTPAEGGLVPAALAPPPDNSLPGGSSPLWWPAARGVPPPSDVRVDTSDRPLPSSWLLADEAVYCSEPADGVSLPGPGEPGPFSREGAPRGARGSAPPLACVERSTTTQTMHCRPLATSSCQQATCRVLNTCPDSAARLVVNDFVTLLFA